MLTDEDERLYNDLVGETAYDKLLDLRQKHLRRLKVCGRSKWWWNGEISAQLAVVRDHQRRYGRNREWVKERYRLRDPGGLKEGMGRLRGQMGHGWNPRRKR